MEKQSGGEQKGMVACKQAADQYVFLAKACTCVTVGARPSDTNFRPE